jgi:hypothetical protein
MITLLLRKKSNTKDSVFWAVQTPSPARLKQLEIRARYFAKRTLHFL